MNIVLLLFMHNPYLTTSFIPTRQIQLDKNKIQNINSYKSQLFSEPNFGNDLNDLFNDDVNEDFYEPIENALSNNTLLEKLDEQNYNTDASNNTFLSQLYNPPSKSHSNHRNDSIYINRNGRGVQNKYGIRKAQTTRSENFEVHFDTNVNFEKFGGYDTIKEELLQCSDTLLNPEKYKKFNVRTPKGIIFEGPPGNGKTLLVKAFCGEIQYSFIPVSGSQFQERYVGVGSARIRELFDLARENKPCVIFIDEIDAVGRKRGDGESSHAERDNTLNELLVQMDGFKELEGIFIICATNRYDLLDEALLRPGRIDKKIFVGLPNKKTRLEIIKVHMDKKSCNKKISHEYLAEITNGFSGAQIENLVNEAMLLALRKNKTEFDLNDLEVCIGKTYAGFQAVENAYSNEMIKRIAVHEMGHAISGMLQKEHSKLTSVHINPFSPRTPGYTIFETDEIDANIFTQESLFARLVVLLSGRMAELVIFEDKAGVTTGASHDFEEARKLATEMIQIYGMGSHDIFPGSSDKSKEIIDDEVNVLLRSASSRSHYIIEQSKDLIKELSESLILDNKLSCQGIELKMYRKFSYLFDIEFD